MEFRCFKQVDNYWNITLGYEVGVINKVKSIFKRLVKKVNYKLICFLVDWLPVKTVKKFRKKLKLFYGRCDRHKYSWFITPFYNVSSRKNGVGDKE